VIVIRITDDQFPAPFLPGLISTWVSSLRTAPPRGVQRSRRYRALRLVFRGMKDGVERSLSVLVAPDRASSATRFAMLLLLPGRQAREAARRVVPS